MIRRIGGFVSKLPIFAACLVLALLSLAALVYVDNYGVPRWVLPLVLPAFLFEIGLYLASCDARVRAVVERWRPASAAALLTASAGVSYCMYTVPMGAFDIRGFGALIALGAVASYWFVVFGKRSWADVMFLLVMGLPILLKVFPLIYPDPARRVPMHILGALMWYRIGIVAVLSMRRIEGVGFGLVPRARDWRIGVLHFAAFLPVGYALAISLDFIKPQPTELSVKTALIAVATFAGVLWVLAVAEEFFFRGLLQQSLSRAFRSNVMGLLVTSLIFGAVHLGYRDFPNWPFALLAGCAGLFYGSAFLRAGSIRAAMVTHALVVTTWRVFLA